MDTDKAKALLGWAAQIHCCANPGGIGRGGLGVRRRLVDEVGQRECDAQLERALVH